MTKKVSFSKKWDELVRCVYFLKRVPDVLLMERLEISPPSWKVWKSQFIEKSKYSPETVVSEEGQEIDIKIMYIKKEKRWEWENWSHTDNDSPFEKRERE